MGMCVCDGAAGAAAASDAPGAVLDVGWATPGAAAVEKGVASAVSEGRALALLALLARLVLLATLLVAAVQLPLLLVRRRELGETPDIEAGGLGASPGERRLAGRCRPSSPSAMLVALDLWRKGASTGWEM